MRIPNKSLWNLSVCIPEVIQEFLLPFRRIRGISSRARHGPARDVVARAERTYVLGRVYALKDSCMPSSKMSVERTWELKFVLVQLGRIQRGRLGEWQFGFSALVVGESFVVWAFSLTAANVADRANVTVSLGSGGVRWMWRHVPGS